MLSDPELGNIEFAQSDRAKHIRVRIFHSGLKVTLPYHATEHDALKFIDSIRQKIISKQNKLKNGLQKNSIIIDEYSQLRTLTFTVHANPGERKNIYFALKNDILKIEFPHGTDCKAAQVQQHFWNGISYFLRKEAKRILPERTKLLAKKHGFNYEIVKIQSSKSRWGSCSRGGNINLSLYLMLLPIHLIDYVILHELCHTKEMNHGVNFWRWMDRVTENKSKELRAELKNYNMPN